MDDRGIIELYWKRDEQAIQETADRYGAYCMRISMNILNNRADSDENVNDTYLRAWKSIPPARPPNTFVPSRFSHLKSASGFLPTRKFPARWVSWAKLTP